MIWEEFREQAQQDMASSSILFRHNDYGNSAYLLQQGLEKYVKAYIFRFEIFVGQPYKLTHLPLLKLWELLVDKIEKKIVSSSPDVRELFKKSALMLGLVKTFYMKMSDRNDPQHRAFKYGVWKDSLGINLDQRESSLVNQLKNEMEQELLPLVMEMQHQLSDKLHQIIPLINSNQAKRKATENIIKEIMDIPLDELLHQNNSTTDLQELAIRIPMFFEHMNKLIKKITSMAERKQNFLQQDLMKLLLLAWIFFAREEIIATFPHEDIGRYPEIIDGLSTRKIYADKAQKLEELSKRVSLCCKKIDDMLYL